MSPASTTDTTLPGTNSALFNIPKLADDGLNWITYKERMLTAIGARGLMRYTNGRKVKPIPFVFDTSMKKLKKPDGSKPTKSEVEDLDVTHKAVSNVGLGEFCSTRLQSSPDLG